MTCTCSLWAQNIEKVNAPRALAAARNPGTADYDGVIFKFCPWCGSTLIEDNPPEKNPVHQIHRDCYTAIYRMAHSTSDRRIPQLLADFFPAPRGFGGLFCTDAEARAAINKYNEEWRKAKP